MVNRTLSPGLALIAIFSCGCERSDPLSARPNSTGTAILEDKLIGADSRVICVTATLQETCNSRQSEIYVEDVENLNDVTARWIDDELVMVEVVKGTVRRSADRSRDGRIAIRLKLNAPSPSIRVETPDGAISIPRPRS